MDRRFGEIETALAELQNRPRSFDPADINRAGAFVSFDAEGFLSVDRGYVRPEDEPPMHAQSTNEDAGAGEFSPVIAPVTPQAVITIAGRPGDAEDDGFGEVLYAFASTTSDNGSIFGGLSVDTVWFDTSTGVVMLAARLASVIPIMAIAGSLARKKKAKPSAGTFPTDGLLFSLLLQSVAVIVTLLDFFPALTLGPLAEQALMSSGRTF